jgi:hypothetical protein
MKAFQSLIGLALLTGLIWLATGCNQEAPVSIQEAADFKPEDLPFSKAIPVSSEDGETSILLTVYADDASVLDIYTEEGFAVSPLFDSREESGAEPTEASAREKVASDITVAIRIEEGQLPTGAIGYQLSVNLPASDERAKTWEYFYSNADYGRVTLNSSWYNVFMSAWSRYPGDGSFTASFLNYEIRKKGAVRSFCASGSEEIKIGVQANNHSNHYSLAFFSNCP